MISGCKKKTISMVWTLVQDGRGHAGEKSVQRSKENHKKLQRKIKYASARRHSDWDADRRLEGMEEAAKDRVRWKAPINGMIAM